MGPDLDAPGTPLRCPSCAAAVRPDAPWCTQCYVALRSPAPTASSPAAPASLPAPPSPSPAAPARRLLPGDDPAWPCTTCGAVVPITDDACRSCGAGFLAALKADDEPLLVLPVVGDLGAMSRAQRLGLAGGVVLAVVLLTALLGLLLG